MFFIFHEFYFFTYFLWFCKYCASILNPWNTRKATCQQDGDFPLSSPSWRKRCSHTTFWEIWSIGEQQIFYHPRLSGIVTKILILPTDGDLTYSKIQSPFMTMMMMTMMTTTVMMRMIARRWRGEDYDEVTEESYLKEQPQLLVVMMMKTMITVIMRTTIVSKKNLT